MSEKVDYDEKAKELLSKLYQNKSQDDINATLLAMILAERSRFEILLDYLQEQNVINYEEYQQYLKQKIVNIGLDKFKYYMLKDILGETDEEDKRG